MSESVLVKFSRKPTGLDDVKSAFESSSNTVTSVAISETKELSTAEYDIFTESFLTDRDWLDGKGGHVNGKLSAIEVTAPDRPTLYVNPEGGRYARYVGLRQQPKQASLGPKYPHVRVQLVGKDGNAFFIMGRVQQAAQRGKVPPEEIKRFMDEARSGDYDNLLATCMRWFDCY